MPRYGFGEFVVDTTNAEILGPEDDVRAVEPQVFDVLEYLIEQRGRLVTKEELLDNVWGDRFVSESALTTRIKQARRAIDDDGSRQWAIKTAHGRGYRFVPEVTLLDDRQGGTSSTPERPTAPIPEELRADARQLFCGREAELEQCAAVLDAASPTGPFGWIWLLGEPGIGKTRLAAEVARAAHERGHRVLFGRNSEDLRVPYQPFLEVIRQSPDTGDEAALPSEVAVLLPEAALTSGEAAASVIGDSGVDDELKRYQMFEAMATWLDALAADGPVTMIVDDVHWAADSTLQLLGHLLRRPNGGAVTLVLTSRDTAPDLGPRVSDLIAAAQGVATSTVLRLAGLPEEQAVRLVGTQVDLAEAMRQTAGNPLFLQAVNSADGSVDMQSALRRRLSRLDESVQETLRVVSVLGLEFELRVAAAANGRDELQLLDELELAIAARLIDEVGHDRFRFAHALVRSSLREEISSSRRARMHGRIAQALSDLFGDDIRHLPDLAFHTSEAAAVDHSLAPVAIERLRRAARESMSQVSFSEASDLLRRAVRLIDPTDDALMARVLVDLGIAETRASKNMTAVRTFRQAVDAAQRSGDIELWVESAVRHEDASWRPGLPGEVSLELLEEARTALDRAEANGEVVNRAHELRVRMAICTFRALAMSGRPDEVPAAFDEARRLAAESGSANVEANVLSVYLGHVQLYEQVQGADEMVARLAELEPLIDDADVALHALHDRLLYATLVGRFEERRELVRSMTVIQERSHSRFWRFIRTNQEAMDAFYLGDLGASEALSERCLQLANELPDEDGSGTYGLRMFLIRREQDRLGPVAPMLRQVVRSSDDAVWTPGLALLLAETGSLDEAAEALAPAKRQRFELPIDAMWSTVMVLFAETIVRLGDTEACQMLREQFGPLRGSNVTTGSGLLCFGRAERYLGMLAYVLDELSLAEELLSEALEADVGGGSVLWGNESRYWLALTRRAQGHDAEAEAMLDVVAKQTEAAGLMRLHRMAVSER